MDSEILTTLKSILSSLRCISVVLVLIFISLPGTSEIKEKLDKIYHRLGGS